MKISVSLYIVAVVLAVSPGCQAHSPADGSVTGRPPTMPPPLSVPAGEQQVPQAATVEEALDFTDDEKTILEDVTDGDGQLSTPALYVLLRRAEMLPEGAATLEKADQPNPENFWREPARYRGRLVRVEGLYARTTDWSKNAALTRWWGRRSVWMVDLHDPKTKKPILVALTRKPPKGLSPGRRVRFAGIFYKVVTLRGDAEKGDPSKKIEYPVIVAKTVSPVLPSGSSIPKTVSPVLPSGSRFPLKVVLMFAVVIALLLAFMRLRRGVTRQRAAAGGKYKPSRFEDAAPGPQAESGQDQVDEELRRQVESYRAERHGGSERPAAGPVEREDADNT